MQGVALGRSGAVGGTQPFRPQVGESPWLQGRCPRGLTPSWLLTSGLVLDGWGAYRRHGAARCRVLGDKWQMPSASPAPRAPMPHDVSPAAQLLTSGFHFTSRTAARNGTALRLIFKLYGSVAETRATKSFVEGRKPYCASAAVPALSTGDPRPVARQEGAALPEVRARERPGTGPLGRPGGLLQCVLASCP